jgi:hypothetical protein
MKNEEDENQDGILGEEGEDGDGDEDEEMA